MRLVAEAMREDPLTINGAVKRVGPRLAGRSAGTIGPDRGPRMHKATRGRVVLDGGAPPVATCATTARSAGPGGPLFLSDRGCNLAEPLTLWTSHRSSEAF